MRRFTSVDDYLAQAAQWNEELARLRDILAATPLEETIKWNAPCYTHSGRNVVGIGGFTGYFGLWFHDGALLKDRHGVLINAQPGKTRGLRQWRMTSARDLRPTIIRRYVAEAIKLVDAGQGLTPRKSPRVALPPELRDALRTSDDAARAFERLRPGQRREYARHVAEAKRPATRVRRAAAALPHILAGDGLNDRYRKPRS